MGINNKKNFYLILIWVLTIFSCGLKSSDNANSRSEETVSNDVKAATIIDARCSSDQSVTFSYYLPKSYKEGKKYPVLLLFDPHGDGHYALNKYTAASDKFEYILMSTNDIKNGLDKEAAAHVMQSILLSTTSQIPVNPTRVYVGGFSGGARYASMMAMSGSGIQGLITCGAGFPVESWQGLSPSVIIAAANDGDMNLPEILNLSSINDREQLGRLLIFRDAGIHEWPSSDKMEEMIAIFTAYAIRDSIETEKNKLDSVITTYSRLHDLKYCNSSKIIQAAFIEREIKTLGGLTNIEKQKSSYLKVINSSDYSLEKSKEAKLVAEENTIKNHFYSAMGSQDTTWWHNEMAKLNNSILNEKDELKQSQLMRIRNGLSLMCYMNLDKTMKANSNQDAYYLSILYRNIDPDNSESWFLASVMEARNQNNAMAIDYLNTAVKKGFNQRVRVNQTQEFNSLLGDPRFQEVVNQIPN